VKLTVFQSDKGDCLLLTSRDGKRMLVDGGMADSYRAHVAPALGRLARAGHGLDLVYVSHIDEDHVAGILELMSNLVAWRVYDYQRESGNTGFKAPDVPRPPEVAGLWHNPFSEQAGKNVGEIESVLAASASVLEAGRADGERADAAGRRELAASVGQAIELSRRVSPEQLGIPVNRQFGGKRVVVGGADDVVALGSLRLTVIGPFEEDLRKLRGEWNDWLGKNQAELERVRKRMRADTDRLANADVDVDGFRDALRGHAQDLRAGTKDAVARRSRVTTPNLASLMLFVEEGDTTVLLTGDGHQREVLRGLEAAGKLDGGNIHVNVLKVQHHGSEHNIDAEFCRHVTADHYVWCANGSDENPDLDRVAALIDTRLEKPDGRFKLWFNSSPRATEEPKHKLHMREVQRLVRSRVLRGKGRMTATFLDGHSFDVRPL
jgi:metallo-beta-lactamase superfamily protein